MGIPSRQVHDILSEKGVTELFHANSVATACHFLRSNSLLSRGTVERLGHFQTSQKSDTLDQRSSLWYDIFVDTVDIHQRAKRANVYGPVTFVMDAMMILKCYTGKIWVTKLNPTKWEGKSDKERWFQDKEDLKENFMKGQFDQMLVFRHCGGELPFNGYLKHIIIDDPEIKVKSVDFYSLAIGAMWASMPGAEKRIKIKKRKCSSSCICKTQYDQDRSLSRKMYIPIEPKNRG